MGHEGRPVAVVKEEGRLRPEVGVRLAERREDGVVERARGAQRLGQVEERRRAVLAHALVALLGADPRRQLARDERHREIRAEEQHVLEAADREREHGGMKRKSHVSALATPATKTGPARPAG